MAQELKLGTGDACVDEQQSRAVHNWREFKQSVEYLKEDFEDLRPRFDALHAKADATEQVVMAKSGGTLKSVEERNEELKEQSADFDKLLDRAQDVLTRQQKMNKWMSQASNFFDRKGCAVVLLVLSVLVNLMMIFALLRSFGAF